MATASTTTRDRSAIRPGHNPVTKTNWEGTGVELTSKFLRLTPLTTAQKKLAGENYTRSRISLAKKLIANRHESRPRQRCRPPDAL